MTESKPLGATFVELLRMPVEVLQDGINTVNDALPEIQSQVKDLPSIIRENVQFGITKFKEMPQQLQQGTKTEASNTNMPLLFSKVVSPVPLLSREEMAATATASVAKQAELEKITQLAQQDAQTAAERTKNFAQNLAAMNSGK